MTVSKAEKDDGPSLPPPPVTVVLAPMVRGSELAFRQVVRKYHIATCYSPMLRANHVVQAFAVYQTQTNEKQQQASKDGDPSSGTSVWTAPSNLASLASHEDGLLFLTDILPDPEPVVVQLCGNDPIILQQAVRALLNVHYSSNVPCHIQGIDYNLGCPQTCANKDNFGAFLVENNPQLAIDCVRSMRQTIDDEHSSQIAKRQTNDNLPSKPQLSCKIRLLDNDQQTITFAQDLVAAGCELLAVHCRRRQTKSNGPPNFTAGRALVQNLSSKCNVPVLINGGIMTKDDVRNALQQTKAYGVMMATGLLQNPRILVEPSADPASLAAEYLLSCQQYPPPTPLYIQKHLRWIFRKYLEPKEKASAEMFKDWRPRLWTFLVRPYLETIPQFQQVVALYVRLNGSNIPESLRDQPEPSFKSIKRLKRSKVDPTIEAGTELQEENK